MKKINPYVLPVLCIAIGVVMYSTLFMFPREFWGVEGAPAGSPSFFGQRPEKGLEQWLVLSIGVTGFFLILSSVVWLIAVIFKLNKS